MQQVAHYGDTGRNGRDWRPQEMDAAAHLGIDLAVPDAEPFQITVAREEQVGPVEPPVATHQEVRYHDTQVASVPEEPGKPESSHVGDEGIHPSGERIEQEKPRVIVWGNFPKSRK